MNNYQMESVRAALENDPNADSDLVEALVDLMEKGLVEAEQHESGEYYFKLTSDGRATVDLINELLELDEE